MNSEQAYSPLMADARLSFYPLAFVANESQWYRELVQTIDWEQHEVRLFGKVHPTPRLSAWYGDAEAVYGYSGVRLQPRPWTPMLARLKAQIETAAGREFNSVLLNWYRDGRDCMGWHADDEAELGQQPFIASLSVGGSRACRFRRRDKAGAPVKLELSGGSLLLMAGATQSAWLHSIPRTRRKVAGRINLTFRTVLA